MTLTADELAELTGYPSARGQRRWLDDNGWRYVVARDGSPRVARAYALQQMGVVGETVQSATEPNWQAIA